MSLTELSEKIKSFAKLLTRKDIYAALTIVLVGLASFFLGAMWQKDKGRPEISISLPAADSINSPQADSGDGNSTDAYIGSYTSKIYRLATCPGVSAISAQNKVYFATKASAEAAGYVPAKNCKM